MSHEHGANFHPGQGRRASERSGAHSSALAPLLQECGIIPAVRKPEHLERALAAHGRIIYLLCGDPETIGEMMQAIAAVDKLPIVNVDLLSGLSRDVACLRYLQRRGARGVISTHSETLRHAQSLGLYTIQRTFLLDSGAMEAVCHQLKHSTIDALEVLPAIALPKLMERVASLPLDMPLVGGGLVTSLREAQDLLNQGVTAVSVSAPDLWIP